MLLRAVFLVVGLVLATAEAGVTPQGAAAGGDARAPSSAFLPCLIAGGRGVRQATPRSEFQSAFCQMRPLESTGVS